MEIFNTRRGSRISIPGYTEVRTGIADTADSLSRVRAVKVMQVAVVRRHVQEGWNLGLGASMDNTAIQAEEHGRTSSHMISQHLDGNGIMTVIKMEPGLIPSAIDAIACMSSTQAILGTTAFGLKVPLLI